MKSVCQSLNCFYNLQCLFPTVYLQFGFLDGDYHHYLINNLLVQGSNKWKYDSLCNMPWSIAAFLIFFSQHIHSFRTRHSVPLYSDSLNLLSQTVSCHILEMWRDTNFHFKQILLPCAQKKKFYTRKWWRLI